MHKTFRSGNVTLTLSFTASGLLPTPREFNKFGSSIAVGQGIPRVLGWSASSDFTPKQLRIIRSQGKGLWKQVNKYYVSSRAWLLPLSECDIKNFQSLLGL